MISTMEKLILLLCTLLISGPAFSTQISPFLVANSAILTPNGDGVNDWVNFTLPDDQRPVAETAVYTLKGARVAELVALSPSKMGWNGNDSTGRPVESGMYLIQIVQQGLKPWTGVVNVAK